MVGLLNDYGGAVQSLHSPQPQDSPTVVGLSNLYGGAVKPLHSPPPCRKDSPTGVGPSNLYGGAIKPLHSPAIQKGQPHSPGLNFTNKFQKIFKKYVLHAS